MASSPTEFTLQELTACWDQGYEALARADLERVASLLTIADDLLRGLQSEAADSPPERQLRSTALAARGRLEYGLRTGLTAVREELAKVRQGAKALGSYRPPGNSIGDRVHRHA